MEIVAKVLDTEAILISNPHTKHQDIVKLVKRRVEGHITSIKYVMVSYNVHNDLVESAVKIIPGMKSPNITSLMEENYKAISCLIEKKNSAAIMDELRDLGATDILTFELSNTRNVRL